MLFGEWRSERSEGVKTNDCFLEFRSSDECFLGRTQADFSLLTLNFYFKVFSCSLPLAP